MISACLGMLLLLGSTLAPAGQAATTVELRPGMAALDPGGAPPLWQSVPDADRLALGMGLDPEQPYRWVVSPGEAFAITARTPAETAHALLTIWDWARRPVAQLRLDCPARETVTLEAEGAGVWLLTLDAMQGQDCRARLVRSFGVLPSNEGLREQWRSGAYLVGACSFPGRQHWTDGYGPGHPPGLSEQASREMDADLCVRLGLQVIRPDLPIWWGAEEQGPDFTRADECLGMLTRRGFTLDVQLGPPGGADWAVLGQYAAVTDPKWRYPVREDIVRRMSAECAVRYGEYAEFFELYNEPDNLDFWRGTPGEYVDYCRWAAEEIRRRTPGARIANGGLTFIVPQWTGFFTRELRDCTDLIAYHSHGGVDAMRQTFGALEAVMAAAERGATACVNTEMGHAAWRLDAEMPMAATAVQKLLYGWAHGHRAALLYCSREISGPRMTAGDWGMVDYFMCPRFMYGAVAAFIRHYAGARFERVLQENDRLMAYVLRRGDERLVALFVPRDAEQHVSVRHDGATAFLLDPMGNRSECPAGSEVQVKAGLYPLTVVLRGGDVTSVVLSD